MFMEFFNVECENLVAMSAKRADRLFNRMNKALENGNTKKATRIEQRLNNAGYYRPLIQENPYANY